VSHGSSEVTKDVDICIVFSAENLERLRRALGDANPVHRMTHQKISFLRHPAAGEPVHTLYLQTDLGLIDVLSSVLGVGDFQRLCEKAETLDVEGRRYRVMSLDDLIRAKEALGREKDLLTAKELRAIAAKRDRT
jgi:hypothetical protein